MAEPPRFGHTVVCKNYHIATYLRLLVIFLLIHLNKKYLCIVKVSATKFYKNKRKQQEFKIMGRSVARCVNQSSRKLDFFYIKKFRKFELSVTKA